MIQYVMTRQAGTSWVGRVKRVRNLMRRFYRYLLNA